MVFFAILIFIILSCVLLFRVAVGLIGWILLLIILITIANIINRDKENDSGRIKYLKHTYRVIGTGIAFLVPGLIRWHQTADYYTAWNGTVVLNGPDYLSILTTLIGVIIVLVGIIKF